MPGTEHTSDHTIENKTVLVTGANRGIGRALVDEALRRGARRVYAGTRRPFDHPDERVTPLILDVTNDLLITQAAAHVDELDVLINNAGVSVYDDLGDKAPLERHLAVNLFGTHALTQAFRFHLTRSRGAVVNVLSVAALASVPVLPAYSISKAAAFSLTQSQRALLAPQGVRVHAVLAGPVDTDMVRDLNVPKVTAESVAKAILDGVADGQEEIFPDPVSASLAPAWPTSATKALERENAALIGTAR
jgi:NAD(P)-dependent dehydrogenase (short-subunit alcohol dehydrogenase family)